MEERHAHHGIHLCEDQVRGPTVVETHAHSVVDDALYHCMALVHGEIETGCSAHDPTVTDDVPNPRRVLGSGEVRCGILRGEVAAEVVHVRALVAVHPASTPAHDAAYPLYQPPYHMAFDVPVEPLLR